MLRGGTGRRLDGMGAYEGDLDIELHVLLERRTPPCGLLFVQPSRDPAAAPAGPAMSVAFEGWTGLIQALDRALHQGDEPASPVR
jgi:hypothetical protein